MTDVEHTGQVADFEGLSKVRLGISLVFYGLELLALTIILLLGCAIWFTSAHPDLPPDSMIDSVPLIGVLLLILVGIISIMTILGMYSIYGLLCL